MERRRDLERALGDRDVFSSRLEMLGWLIAGVSLFLGVAAFIDNANQLPRNTSAVWVLGLVGAVQGLLVVAVARMVGYLKRAAEALTGS